MKDCSKIFHEMISLESLFEAWFAFRKGKSKRRDVQEFGRYLERNIFRLHRQLSAKTYTHDPYSSFYVRDPKVRHIRKASVKDRIVHQAVYTKLVAVFDPSFIADLYSSRLGKGTHAGVNALAGMARKVSRNNTRSCWALKCDIRRFYDTVNHGVLCALLGRVVSDQDAMWLLQQVIGSFHIEGAPGKGLPIGNLTSQIFTNIYLNELDQFVKHVLNVKHYARFADDFVLLSESKRKLRDILPALKHFLKAELLLELHPHKVEIRPLQQGIDFLGYVILPYHRVIRTRTKRRMLRKLSERQADYFKGEASNEALYQTMQSYLGMLSHGDTHQLRQKIKNVFCWK